MRGEDMKELIINADKVPAIKPILPALILCLFLVSCAIAPLAPMDFTSDTRTIDVIVGTDGTHSDDTIMGLFEQFNADAITETGIRLNVTQIIPFDMSEQVRIWPACQHDVPCWADYVFLNGYKYDVAVFFTHANPLAFLFGGVVGVIDDTKLRYIVLYSSSYWNFKHHLYHVFCREHDWAGVMSPIESINFIPVASTNLTEESRKEILRNKYREFK
jgi:hypothetical protein